MALPMLVGGTECGPSNPLQGLSKRFDSDRGLQQDYFGPGRARSSQETFRSHTSSLPFDQDAAQFFAKLPPPQFSGDAYDLGAVRDALPAVRAQQLGKQSSIADWAADFLTQQPMHTFSPQASAVQSTAMPIQSSSMPSNNQALNMTQPAQLIPLRNGMATWASRMQFVPPVNALQHVDAHPGFSDPQISWTQEFDAQQSDSGPIAGPSNTQKEALQSSSEQDQLARTAGLLLETVKTERNPKFRDSTFMNLMTQLRDQKVVVRGNEMVENDGTVTVSQESHVDLKGKGKASDFPFISHSGSVSTSGQTIPGSMATLARRSSNNEQIGIQEEALDAYFRQENEDYMQYWNGMDPRKAQRRTSEIDLPWNKLQTDWDKFEASTQGITPVISYQFQKNNPYLRGDNLRTRHHSMHLNERLEVCVICFAETSFMLSQIQTVLELEAAIQKDMSDASAWFELGVKQQEHERETQALRALTRATELDPSYLPGWLALAVSFTNDGRRLEAYEAIREWVLRNDNHRDILQQHLFQNPDSENATTQEKFNQLIQCLITMAQQSAVGQIDADIQIALAVLFNSNEDYGKAQDCFRAALSVRPDDWQLYNRVGATMANSGRAGEALEYYYRALDLNPAYVRARYNLGISCINLKRYNEGAQHILDALSLQDAEGVHDVDGYNDARGGITSNALWDSLKTSCLHMQRADLATLCDKKDLEGACNVFVENPSAQMRIAAFRFNYQFQ
ncbi:hypothetical protein F5050DRAFT_1683192 [Lentinula boryana]|uniref:TPR-like protein n=1 Tax=Lentinula boryana TaxID=40481 RepID=A0ABQ8QSQ6_9AGAR|nr:hypothetical protein F5050DRAFT_1683192 [Lentinula boryana]